MPYLFSVTAGGNSGPGIVSCIEQFYRDVKERRRERFGETESAFDTR